MAAIRASLMGDFNQGSTTPGAYRAPQSGDFTTTRALPSRSQLSRDVSRLAAEDLALGGALPQGVANLVSRRAASQAGGTGSIALGRDISARDLGLTSLDLMNQRRNAAAQAGAADEQYALSLEDLIMQRRSQDATLYGQEAGISAQSYGLGLDRARYQQDAQAQRLNQAAAISDLSNQGVNRRLQIAGLANSISQPVTGLDPSSVANLAVGNSNVQGAAAANAANLRAASGNSLMQVGGQLGGLAMNYWTTRPTTTTTTAPTYTGTAAQQRAVRNSYYGG